MALRAPHGANAAGRQLPQAADARGKALEGGSSSALLSVLTLLKNMIGAGIFSLPIGLRLATPMPGLVILASIGIMSAVSYWMVGYCCLAWNVTSFRKLWHRTLGSKTAWVIDVTILGNGWFTLVGYLVLIGDFTTKSFGGLLGEGHLLARNRLIDQWVITVGLLLPLSLAQDLRRLAFTSVLGLGVTVYVVLLVLRDSWLNSPPEWGEDTVLAAWRMGSFEAIALYTHAFVAHYNAPKLYSELERPTALRWLIVVVVAYSLAFFVYASFALAGLRRFEGSVEGNVLKNYDMQISVLIAWLGMGFSIAFTYPIVFNSAREACVNLMTPMQEKILSSPRLQRLIASPRSQFGLRGRSLSLYNILGPRPEKPISQGKHNITTVVFVSMTAAVSSICTDVGLVNALAGSIMGCAVAFLFPSLLFFYTVRAQLGGRCSANDSLDSPLLDPYSKPTVAQASPSSRPFLQLSLIVSVFIMVAGIGFGVLGMVVALRGAGLDGNHG
mmetsp:Transcript_145579/g.363075  ORF Transcript_145579/g.363075 Transcript_145579/m.363075 type:complete len:499 (-) Transcript_145579:110-1606(-)